MIRGGGYGSIRVINCRIEEWAMRLAALSDIHGNLVALEAVLADLATVPDIDLYWCLGDLAAFGSRPLECIRRIKALSEQDEGRKFRVIGGNTDRYLIGGERLRLPAAQDEAEFNKLATDMQNRDTITNWSLGQIDFEAYQYLKTILRREISKDVEGYGVVIGYHAVPGDDEAFLTPTTPEELAADYFLDREGRMGIGGHTHRQMERDAGGWHVVNIGAIGMSFDRPGFAQYGIFTFEDGDVTVDLRNIPYDTEAALADLYAVGHPNPEWFASKMRPVAE